MTNFGFSDGFLARAVEWCRVQPGRVLGDHITETMTDADLDKWVAWRFEGETFECSKCQAEIGWPGICTVCEKAEDDPSKPTSERLIALGVPPEDAAHSWSNWLTPKLRGDATSERACLESIEQIQEWRGKPPLLLLKGIPGIGKTHIAIATLARRIQSKGASGVIYRRYTEICETIKDGVTYGNEPFESVLRRRRLVVIDDLGAGGSATWVRDRVLGAICDRIDDGKPMIVTTNLTTGDIEAISPRLASRINDAALKLGSAAMTDWRRRDP
jgi:hypothetical protein